MLSKLRSSLARTITLLVLATPALFAQSFSNPLRIPTPIDPYSIVVGDVNGDGRADILWGDNRISPVTMHVLLAQANGTYLPAASLTLPAPATTECLLADLNKDGHQDLICAGAYQLDMSVLVFLGNGDSTFQLPISTPVPTLSNGAYVAPVIYLAGDLNGDGLPDLIIKEVQSGETQTLLGDGKGGFKPPILLNALNSFAYNPVFVDVNGDGIPDVLWPLGPEVSFGNGDGTFGPVANYAQPSDALASCVFHDMDGDGHLDAVCGFALSNNGDITGGTRLIILHGNPDGTFNTTPIATKTFGDQANQYNGFGTFLTPIAVADLNGDGILDIMADSGDGLAVLLGGPNLTFTTPQHYAEANIGYGGGIYALYQYGVHDINGDGIPDVIAGGPNGIYITYGKKDGTFASAFAAEVTQNIGYATVADFNGDGIPDIAATGDNAVKLSFGKGDGTFATPIALPNNNGAINFSTPLSATNAHILHGDFNGDGKQDILAIGSADIYQYNSYILFGHGDGTFNAPVLVPGSSLTYPMYATLYDSAVVDINHDGRSDVIGVNNSALAAQEQILFSLSNGDGTFTQVSSNVPGESENTGFFYPNLVPALADFSHRGLFDAAYASLNNAYVVNGHGDGTFDSTAVPLPIPNVSGQPSLGSLSIATGDFDGDGNPDFAVLVQYGYGQFPFPSQLATAAWVYYGNGNGTFTSPVLAGIFNRNYTGIAASDLNGDGLTDIILKTSGSLGGGYAVGIIDSQPARSFGPEVNYTAGTGLSSLSIADVNQDGRPDLIFANGDFNMRASSVTVLLNESDNGGGTTGGSATTTTLTCNPSTISIGATSLLSVAVTSATGTPPGSINFTDNNTIPLGQPSLTNGGAALTYTGQAAGTHTILATYVPTGSFAASTASCPIIVNGLPTITTVAVTPNPSTYGQPVVFSTHVAPVAPNKSVPTGKVRFTYCRGATIDVALDTNGNGSVIQPTGTEIAEPVGSCSFTGQYYGDSTFAPSTSAPDAYIVTPSPSTTTILSSSPNPAYLTQPVTLTVQITGHPSPTANPVTGNPIPAGALQFSGTVQLLDAGVPIASGPATAGQSIFTLTTLSIGSHTITAAYSNDPNLGSSTSPPVTEVILAAPPPDFTFTGPPSITFRTEATASTTLTLTSLNNYAGSIALTCNPPLPNNYLCTLNPASVTLAANGTALTTLTLKPNITATNTPLPTHTTERILLASLFPITLLSLIGLSRISLSRKRSTTIRALLSLSLLAILAIATTACGPDHFILATPPGTYPITITATGTNQNLDPPGTPAPTHTLTINAIITR
jgi:hypothetical protein